MPGLEEDYAAAWEEWEGSAEQTDWEHTTAAGLPHAAR